MNNQHIVLLSGKKGSGKDTLAEMMSPDYTRISFADPIYSQVTEAFGLENQNVLRDRATKESPKDELSLDNCSDLDFIEVALANGLTDDGPNSPRTILQLWGTEYRLVQNGKNYWVDQVIDVLEGNRELNFVIPDLRYVAEINRVTEYCLRTGAHLSTVRIFRPTVVKDERSSHPSEVEMDSFDRFDRRINNVESDPEYMLEQIRDLLQIPV